MDKAEHLMTANDVPVFQTYVSVSPLVTAFHIRFHTLSKSNDLISDSELVNVKSQEDT